jgi:hydrogenase maturation protease
MTPFRHLFDPLHGRRICFMGLGNPDYGDDGFGVRLAEELAEAGVQDVLVAGTTPEQHLGRIAAEEFADLVFLDAVEFGAEAGSLFLAGSREIEARFPQISTHKLSLAVLAKLAESNGKTKAWLLGVQPESLKPGQTLSPSVQRTVKIVRELLTNREPQYAANRAEFERDLRVHAC